ncbi:MAG: ABC transporter substrate-binding protein [Candidatus Binatales bacterium]
MALRIGSAILLAIAATAVAPARAIAVAPARIVSLAPAITETLFALGAGPEVVGVSEYCDYPDAARRLPTVGSFLTPNVEAIAGLRPTLVIGLESSSNVRPVRAIEAMGYPTLTVNADTLDEIRTMILKIGERTGRTNQADELVAEIQSHIDSVRARLKDVPPRKVLMLVGHQPIVAVGPGTYLDELVKLAGGINIADRAAQEWPRLSIEYIIATAPEVILDGQMGSDRSVPGGFWSRYPSIPAVRDHRIFGYPENVMLRPGPRVGMALEMLAAAIHPAEAGSFKLAAPARNN